MSIIIGRAIYRALLIREFKSQQWKRPYFENLESWNIIERNRLYSERYTGTPTHLFLIDDRDDVWYKIYGKEDLWKPLFWEGFLTRKPKRLLCDGTNLVIIDDLGKLHYRKILSETRTNEHTDYHWSDLIEKSNYWRPGWAWSIFPFDHYSFKLRIDSENHACCAISHRGYWNSFVTTTDNERIYEFMPHGGCSSFYYYDGVVIWLADPMDILGFSKIIRVPKRLDPNTSFIDASASMLIYFGYDNNIWRFWWKMIDIDMLGIVPFFRYYSKCLTDWDELPSVSLPKSALFKGTKLHNFGNNKRQLRVWFYDQSIPTIYKCKITITKSDWKINPIKATI